jgi:hypothetical protein
MACAKKSYGTKAAAQRRANNLSKEEGKPLYVYQCLSCLMYHLTSKRPPKRSYKRKSDGKRLR